MSKFDEMMSVIQGASGESGSSVKTGASGQSSSGGNSKFDEMMAVIQGTSVPSPTQPSAPFSTPSMTELPEREGTEKWQTAKSNGKKYKPEDMSKTDKVVDSLLGVDRTQVTGEKTNWWEIIKGSASKGMNQWNALNWKTMNFLFGGLAEEIHTLGTETVNGVVEALNLIPGVDLDYIGTDSKNLIEWGYEDAMAGLENSTKKYQANANSSRAAQIVDKFGTSTVAAVPMAIEAILLAPAQAAGAGVATTEGMTYFSGLQSAQGVEAVGMMASEGLKKLFGNPQFWTSYLQVAGDGYENALEEGMSEDDASLYGLVNGFINAAVEIGGADEALGGIQNLPMRLHQQGGKRAVVEWFKDAVLGEAGEEVIQGITERGLLQGMQGNDVREMFSLDPSDTRAAFNPYTSAQEAIGGAVVGGLLGGGQTVVQKSIDSGVNAAVDAINMKQEQRIQDALPSAIKDVFQKSGVELSDTEASLLADGYTPAGGSAQEYIFGTLDAYRMGGIGLTLEQAQNNSKYTTLLHPKQFEHAWQLGSAQKNNAPESGTESLLTRARNLLSKAKTAVQRSKAISNMSFGEASSAVEAGLVSRGEMPYATVSKNTPQALIKEAGAENLPLIMEYDSVYLATRESGALKGHYHNLGAEVMNEIPKALENPLALVKLENGRINAILELSDKKNDPILVSVELSAIKKYGEKFSAYNLALTAFGAKSNYIKSLLSNPKNKVLVNKMTEATSQGKPRLNELPKIVNEEAPDESTLKERVAQGDDNVNTEDGRGRLVSALAALGSHATESADAFEAGQDISTYAAAMNKAASLYAAHGADLKTIVQQARDGETADIVGVLTDAQVETAMQIGQQMQAKSRERVRQLDAQFKSIHERAAALQNEGIDTSIEAAKKELDEVTRRFNEKLDAQEGEDAYAELDALAERMNELDSEIKKLEAGSTSQYGSTSQSRQSRDSSPSQGEPSKPVQRKKGTVSFEGIDRSKLNRQEKNIAAMVERLADLVNIDYVIVNGEKGTGGAYHDGKVYINLNFGMKEGLNKHIAAASLSHELTHFMQDFAPEEYAELRDYVVSAILRKSPAEFDALVKQQQTWEPGKSYDELVDEMVANACQTMLMDDRAVTKLARQNMSLAEKVADVLEDIRAKIKAAFEEIDFSADTSLFRPVRAVMDEMDAIAERWSDGIAAATENYNALQTVGMKNAAPESGVRYQKIGVNEYGEEVYETAKQLQGLSYAEKLAMFKANFYTPGTPQYIGQRIRFLTKTGTYFAEIDRFTQRENINKINPGKLNQTGKAKINIGAAGDFVTLLENAQVDEENVPKKKQNNSAKKRVTHFDYFLKNVEIDGKRFTVIINIRATESGKYVYEVSLRPLKRTPEMALHQTKVQRRPREANASHRGSEQSISDAEQNSKGQHQRWDNTSDDTAEESRGRELAYTRLQSENAILNETVAELRKLTDRQNNTIGKLQDKLRLTKTPEARQSDARRQARAYLSEYGSRADMESIAGQLKTVGDYILQTPAAEVATEEMMNRARPIAAEIAENAYEQVSFDEENSRKIADEIKGKKLSIDEDFLGELDGGFETFRKRNFGRFMLSKRGRNTAESRDGYQSVDQFYADMQGEYGKSYFPDVANEGEELGILEQLIDAAKPIEVNPFERHMGEAVEEIANRIVMDAMSGVLRPTEPTSADKQRARTQALRDQILQLRDENKLERREAGRLYQTIYDLSLALDKSESKYESLRQAADYRTAQMMAEGRARATEAKAKERERAARQISALKEHYKEVNQQAKERREESAGITKYRKQVDKKAKALYDLLLTNSNDKHVPQALKEPLAEFLETLDFSSRRKLNGGAETRNDAKMGTKLQKLQQLLDRQQHVIEGAEDKTDDDLDSYLDIAPDMLDYLREMNEKVTAAMDTGRDFTINQMSAEELKGLSKLLSNLTAGIKNINSFMANARFESVREAASADVDHMAEMGKLKETNGVSKFTMWDNGVPYYVFKRFGEGGRSIFEGFTKGWEKMAFNAREVIDFTEKTYADKEVRQWKQEQHEIELVDGSRLTMTTGQIMELSQLLGREQAVKHISAGGIRIGEIETKHGKLNDAERYHLSAEDITNIMGLLSDRQLEVARQMQQFMAKRGAEWGNEVSMKRFGYKFYEEGEGYYPIRTVQTDRPTEDVDAQKNSMFRLLNLSSSKATNPKASNALVVSDIFDTFADHMSDMAKLNGMGLPVLDAIKWFNFKERSNNADGTYDVRGVQQAMESAYGNPALRYFRTLMKDINGMTESGDRGMDIFNKMLSNAKAASVGANLRVAFLQPTSYVRAQTVLKPKYMMMAFTRKNAYKEALEYSGTAVWKSLGYYDTDISKSMRGQIQHNDSLRDKLVEKSMVLAEWGDKLTWGRLWVACQMQAQAENKGLSGEALRQKTADLFREVIYSSQVMDATLTRSEIMRGKGAGGKMVSAFMAEPTLSYNILMDAYSDYRIDERKYGRGEAWQRNKGRIGKALIVYTSSAAASAVAEAIFDALRNDDDDEFFKKFVEALPGNFFQNMDLIGKIPVLKDALSILQGYSGDNLALAGITDTVDAIKIWEETYKLATGELEKATKVTSYGKMTEWGKIYKTLSGLSKLSGIPGSNMLRDVFAIWNTLVNGVNDNWKIRRYDSNALSQSEINAWKTGLEPLGITKAQFKEFIATADADGNGSLKQDEVGEYLNKEIDAGNISQEQAAALWAAAGSAWAKTYADWRDGGKVKTTAAKAPEETDIPTGYEAFKTSAPLYGNEKKQAAYDVWETQLSGSMTLERFTDFLDAADTDGNDSIKQDELGYALRQAMDGGELDYEQAVALWGSQGWKRSFDWWTGKH